MKLSLAMIAKGELENLKRLKPLVENHIDEWIVVFPPKDKAISWAKKNGIKAIVKDFTQPIEQQFIEQFKEYGVNIDSKYRLFNFANARNESFRHATGDYILWLDADDVPLGLKELREYIIPRGQFDMFDVLYDYSRDKEGNPISDHYRERIIKNNAGFEWRGAALGVIHETVVATGVLAPKKVEVPKDIFRVEHSPEAGHDESSLHRNHIALLYEYLRTKGADARTTYYLGTSFFNMKQYELCVQVMQEYIKVGGWDEERYRAWVRMAEAYHQIGDKESSRNAYLNATKELPNYPDAWMGMGESYYSDEEWAKAIEFLMIGMQKPVPKTKSAVDLVKYSFRPLPFLCLSLIKLGKSLEAYNWFLKAKKLNPKHPWISQYEGLITEMKELDDYIRSFIKVGQLAKKFYPQTLEKLAEAIPEEIQDQEVLLDFKRRFGRVNTWGDKSIVIFGSMAFEDWGADSLVTGCGGSEEAVIHLSKRWAKMGWEVTIFNNCPKEEIRDGVAWRRYENFNPRDDFNILISWRNNPFIQEKRARLKFIDLHDVPNNQYYPASVLGDVNMMVKSQYHRSLLPQLEDSNFKVITNGIDLAQFNGSKKIKNKMIWTSSLDRGLEYLLEAWADIKKAVPDALLDVFYGFELWDASPYAKTEKGRLWRSKMVKLLDQEGVNFIGRVGTDRIAQAYNEADIFPYPSDFPEISCISLMKAQAAKCIPVTSSFAAIKETNRFGVLVDGNPQEEGFMDRYVEELTALLKDEGRKTELRSKIQSDQWSWDLIAGKWDELFRKEQMEKYPLVSVIIPHLPERKEFLEECLASVKEQTYPNVEIIVEEDKGDGRPSIVKNRAIKRAKGEWHYFMDDDDRFWSRHSLMDMMKNSDKGDLIFSDTMLAFPDKEVLMRHWFKGEQDMMDYSGLPGVYLLKAGISKKVLNDESMEVGEDHDRTVRLVLAGAKPYHVPQPHYWYRHHGKQIQYTKSKEQDSATERTYAQYRKTEN